ncbi:adenylate cyclase [Ktedonobacter racemifer DSM 44963]|uniref:Adenylate cyclase n=2 Tax=Ktedonobacter racemifer TaxID=363277 RepID=D6U8M7_KTERA|nr:adenylate cyclase [Ktedonobacter racemifer DSM 44963]
MRFDGEVHNRDIYYDTQDYALLQQAVFVRVRNKEKVEFKFNENIEKVHGQTTERTFPLHPDTDQVKKMNALFTRFLPTWQAQPTVGAAISQNGLVELAHIDNKREEYSQNGIYVSVDHVAQLGDFLEVEVRCDENDDPEKAHTMLQAFVSELDVKHIGVGYVELWLHEHNVKAYQLGKYHL